jgi:hypothetical protein
MPEEYQNIDLCQCALRSVLPIAASGLYLFQTRQQEFLTAKIAEEWHKVRKENPHNQFAGDLPLY